MTQKEAKELTLELWRYLADHPECRYKQDVPEGLLKKIEGFRSHCPLCELFFIKYCDGCPLYAKREYCLRNGSVWMKWHESLPEDRARRKRAAKRIVRIISAWEPEEKR
jgi:hypothetical protein